MSIEQEIEEAFRTTRVNFLALIHRQRLQAQKEVLKELIDYEVKYPNYDHLYNRLASIEAELKEAA